MTKRNSLFVGLLLAAVFAGAFWLAQSGIGQTKTCYICGQIVQDYVEVSAAPKSANVFNAAMMKDEEAMKSATVHYTFCNGCFETLQGGIRWQRQEKTKQKAQTG